MSCSLILYLIPLSQQASESWPLPVLELLVYVVISSFYTEAGDSKLRSVCVHSKCSCLLHHLLIPPAFKLGIYLQIRNILVTFMTEITQKTYS